MKKIIASALCLTMAAAVFAGCDGTKETTATQGSDAPATTADAGTPDTTAASTDAAVDGDKIVINLWSFTDEVPNMIEKYKELNPDFASKYDVKVTIIATTNGEYQPALDAALMAGGEDAPDMYCAEAAFVLKYTQGEGAAFACPYEDLGIDVNAAISEAAIADYSVAIGTNPDGKVVGLGYQATGGCFIYRRSIATEVFGSDDPAAVAEAIGGGSQSWDKFWEAAQTLADKGYVICSGDGDIWHAVENSSSCGWVVDGALTISPEREAFLDLSKDLKDKGFTNDTQDWTDAWFADMAGEGAKGCFGFFGPAWLINYTMGDNCGSTSGDWAVTNSPVGFFWGGTWVLANKDVANADAEKKQAIADIIYWITLDCTENGLQYLWANGLMNDAGTKDSVASTTVMNMSDGSVDFLGGQNMFEYFVPANAYANGTCLTPYDETINSLFRAQVNAYRNGEKDRDAALADFQSAVNEQLGF